MEQGSVFRLHARRVKRFFIAVSIPLEQGSVFRPNREEKIARLVRAEESQSLWNRAVSSDSSTIVGSVF